MAEAFYEGHVLSTAYKRLTCHVVLGKEGQLRFESLTPSNNRPELISSASKPTKKKANAIPNLGLLFTHPKVAPGRILHSRRIRAFYLLNYLKHSPYKENEE